jgi:RNA polymerase sigma factor (TIGR02999 family)
MEFPTKNLTRLLLDWKNGNKEALDELTPVVYQELRRLANSYLRKERADHTLQPTALIHEAYLRLIDQNTPDFQSRAHFFGVAAQLMRQILVDHARAHRAAKRGHGQKVELNEALAYSSEKSEELVALDDALRELEKFDERKCRVIELRFFGGLSIDEIGQVLGVSVATVGRELRMAQAWLYREMSAGGSAAAAAKMHLG